MATSMKYFSVVKQSKKSKARLTLLKTPHGNIHGPFFMPIATRGAVKNISADEMEALGAEILLSNTYHLFLRPGMRLMKKYKGLHNFMKWPYPILTDSGGYQVFSLGMHRRIREDGVTFKDPLDGKKYFLSPESVIQIQGIIGSDIMMVLDECPTYPCTKEYAKTSLALTIRWAKRAKREMKKKRSSKSGFKPLMFGIVQGSVFEDLRKTSAKQIVKIGFDGYAIGGVAVGEPREKMKDILDWVEPILPENKPRYLMGLGRPEELVYAVGQGMDMFDCVIPTREARHGRLYVWNKESGIMNQGKSLQGPFYKAINILNAKYADDMSPVNSTNLKKYSKAYLHHLLRTNELLGLRLATLNNLEFYLTLMKRIREEIRKGKI